MGINAVLHEIAFAASLTRRFSAAQIIETEFECNSIDSDKGIIGACLVQIPV